MRASLAGVILAGGRSSRMGGGDKCLRQISGRPILAHVAERLRPQVEEVALNANGNHGRFAAFNLPVIADPIPDLGPLGGVLAGLLWAAGRGHSHVITAACDTPFFPRDLASRLRSRARDIETIFMARSAGRAHPTFALWPVSLSLDLENFLHARGPISIRGYAGGHQRIETVDFAIEDGQDPFFNINTPQDLETAKRLAKGGG